MKIEISNGQAYVYTPYNGDFVKRIKASVGGAAWNGTKGCWSVPATAVSAVREIMQQVYGRSDISAGETVTLKLTVDTEIYTDRGDVTLLGKCLCHAYGRDSGGRAGDGVAYISGKPKSGGSSKNWMSVVPAGSVIILSDVPKTLYDALEESDDYTVAIVQEEQTDYTALRVERAKLAARLAEIDALLAQEQKGETNAV